MTSISESSPSSEARLFNQKGAIEQLSTDNTTQTVNYEAPTPVLENKIEGGKDKNEKSKFRIRLMKIGAAVVLAIGLAAGGIFVGTKLDNKGNNAGETGLGGGEPTEDSSSIETSATEATTVDPSESLAVTVAPNETSAETASSVEAYAKAMEKYVIMDPVSFDALPRLDRLPYSKYLVDKTIASGEYDLAYGVGTVNEKYRLSYTEVSKENTGQQIINNDMLTTQIAYLQSMNNNKAKIDPIKLEEVLSLNYYEVGSDEKTLSNAYLGVKNFADTLTKPIVAANITTVTDTSELMEGVDNEGNKVSYKIVTAHDQSNIENTYLRFFYCEYKSYDGSDEAVWLLDVQDDSIAGLGQ